jgi:hypothetical protein
VHIDHTAIQPESWLAGRRAAEMGTGSLQPCIAVATRLSQASEPGVSHSLGKEKKEKQDPGRSSKPTA